MRTLIPVLALLALAAPAVGKTPGDSPATRADRELAQLLAGATPGPPTRCLSAFQRRDSRNIFGVGFVYRLGRTFYVNKFQDGCPILGPTDILVTSTPTGELCRGDVARIVDNQTGAFHGTCILGDFTPYVQPKR